MKSAEVKPATPGKVKPRKPFFGGGGEAVEEQIQRQPFFNHSAQSGKRCEPSEQGPDRAGRCIQPKLAIGKTNDHYEKEADATADKVVMRLAQAEAPMGTDIAASGAPAVQAKCAKCAERERQQKAAGITDVGQAPGVQRCAECEKLDVQRRPEIGMGGMENVTGDIESRLKMSRGGGSPLPEQTRKQMETSMGADFSGVRVHTGSEAAEMNHMLKAHAFTNRGDIYFNSGKYDPNHSEGQRLLAHELTHTVQQGAAARKDVEGPEMKAAGAGMGMHPAGGMVMPIDEDGHAKTAEGAKKAIEAKKEEASKKSEETVHAKAGKHGAAAGDKAGYGKKKDEVDKAEETLTRDERKDGGEGQKDGVGNEGGLAKSGTHGKAAAHGTPEHGGKVESGKKAKAHGLHGEAHGEEAAGAPAARPGHAPMESTGNKGAADKARANQSRTKLQGVESELSALTGGKPQFALAANEAKNPALLQQKLRCDESVFNFLNESASVVRNLMAPGAQITTAITSGAAAAKAMVNAESKRQQALASSEFRRLKKQAEAKAHGVIGSINAKHHQTVAKLNADAQIAKAKVLVTHAAAAALLEVNVSVQLPKIDRIYNEAADKFRKAGVTAGDHAVEVANKKADYYKRQAKEWYEMYDDDQAEGILDGPVTARKYDAREEAAREVGKQYRDGDNGLINEGKKQADQLLTGPGKGRDLQMVNDVAAKSRDALTNNYEAALKGIDTFTVQAIKNAGMAKQSLVAAVHNELKSTLQSLEQQLESQKKMLASYSISLADRIDGEAAESIITLTDALAEAGSQLARALGKFKSEIDGKTAPGIAPLDAMLGQIKAGIVSTGGAVHASLNGGLAQSVSSLMKGGVLARTELKTMADGGIAEMRQLVANLQPVLSRLAGAAISLFNKQEKATAQSLEKTATVAAAGFINISTGINQVFAQINTQLTKGLEDSAKQVETSFIAAVDKDIMKVILEEADKAASEVQPRWKKILKVLLVIVVIVVVAVVVGPAVIGFVEAGAAALGASAGVAAVTGTVVGGAIVGAASGAVIQMGNNVIDNKPLMEGVGHAAIVGALTGALGGAAGAVGGKLAGMAAKAGYSALTQAAIKFGVNMAFDFGGNVGIEAVEAWKEGRPMSWGSVMTQMAMSAAMNIGMDFAGKFKGLGKAQEHFGNMGKKAGGFVGGKVKAFGGAPEVKVPEQIGVKVSEPIDVKAPEHPEVKAPEAGEPKVEAKAPEASEVKAPEAGEVKAPEAGEVKAPEAGEIKTPEHVEAKVKEAAEVKTAEHPEAKAPENVEGKAPEPGETKTPEQTERRAPEHVEEKAPEPSEGKQPEPEEGKVPEVEADKYIKGSHPTGDGHEIKVLEDGRIIRCSLNCEELGSRFAEELKGSRRLRKELARIKRMRSPELKAKAAAEFEQKVTKRLIKQYRAANPSSTLEDVDIKAYLDRGARMNPETGRFVGKNGLEVEPDVAAEYHERLGGKEGRRFDPEDLDPATQKGLDETVKEREEAQQKRDRARSEKGYKEGDKSMRDASEEMGNIASDGVMKKTFGKQYGVGEPEYTGSGRNSVDKIYSGKGGRKFVVEAKGANGQLGTKVGTIPGYEGQILQQGTEPYLRQTLEEMKIRGIKNNDMKLRDIANESLEALDAGKLRYFQVDQKVNTAGELQEPRLREFKID